MPKAGSVAPSAQLLSLCMDPACSGGQELDPGSGVGAGMGVEGGWQQKY